MRFYDAVNETIRAISEHPERSPRFESATPKLAELRKRAVRGFPNYLIFYKHDDKAVLIVRVIHGARDLPAVLLDGKQ